MSFLEKLKEKKTALKTTETLVTCADGTRYIEKHSSSNNHKIVPQQPTTGFVIDTAPDEIPALVVPNLYMGSQDSCNPTTLLTYNINQVLSVGIKPPYNNQPGIEFYYVPCLDLPETNLATIFSQCSRIIHEAINKQKNILVHCNAGVSRSASVVIGYLMQHLKMNYDDAFDLLKQARPCVQPNPGFVKQLKAL